MACLSRQEAGSGAGARCWCMERAGGRDQISGSCGVRTFPQGKRAPREEAWEQSSPSFSVNPVFDPAETARKPGSVEPSCLSRLESVPRPNSEAQGALTLGGTGGGPQGTQPGQEVFVCGSDLRPLGLGHRELVGQWDWGQDGASPAGESPQGPGIVGSHPVGSGAQVLPLQGPGHAPIERAKTLLGSKTLSAGLAASCGHL